MDDAFPSTEGSAKRKEEDFNQVDNDARQRRRK